MTNTIKKNRKQDKEGYLLYTINGEGYRAYEVGNLPSKFGTWMFGETQGIGTWFCDHKAGLTFVSDEFFAKWN